MTDDMRAVALRRRLADELEHTGDLHSSEWRRALERVPRHIFIPEFFQWVDTDRGTHWRPVSETSDPDRWLELAYENTTWVTQLDGGTAPSDVSEPVPGEPTSSSTLPGLVVLMLERLDVTEGMNVLEIGTGTGYSTALMCDRLGDDNVTSVEFAPDVAAKAAAALRRLGHTPHLVVGDGLEGDDNRAPFDRVIATCSVRRIPSAWLRQTRPGGRILTTLGGRLHGYGLALLDVGDDGVAEGRYLPGTISFMMARPQAPPMIDDARWNGVSELLTRAEPRPAVVEIGIQQDWTGRFVMQLALPCVLQRTISVDGGPWTEYLIDVTTGSSASLTPEPSGGWTVRQAGPIRLWDEAEKAIGRWRDAGAPAQDEFRVRTDGREQTVWFDTNDGPVSWTLGALSEKGCAGFGR